MKAQDELTINDAAALVNRSPETVRRWVWVGRLKARKSGRNLLVARKDIEGLAAAAPAQSRLTLQEWGELAQRVLNRPDTGGRSASDLVLEARREREDHLDVRR
ncbi:MAG TPA: helix-turn-helix domain-containing protein [Candidatus Dormibacteraeota bacterium]|nr:helix-turn-helix domain-containing protein [Candidatus Dormibacteraeota bacterium]